MLAEETPDVPSPIDLRIMHDAREWESSAMEKRPWRTEFFHFIEKEFQGMQSSHLRVLELGSGPGFLAKHLLNALPAIHLTLLDFSSAMHVLAKQRLGDQAQRVSFIERSLKSADWSSGMSQFDGIVTMQAVHELRHKRHATALHAQSRALLKRGGIYLVCDHYVGEDGMKNDQLFMTVSEQKQALLCAGFAHVEQMLAKGGLVLHRAQ